MVVAHCGQHSKHEIENEEGVLFPSSQFITPIVAMYIHEVSIGTQIQKPSTSSKNTKSAPKPLSFEDPALEAKLFPHLFPYGKGSWQRMLGGITLGAYHKMRLHYVDQRWANDCYYFYFAFDQAMKNWIMFTSKAVTTNKERQTYKCWRYTGVITTLQI